MPLPLALLLLALAAAALWAVVRTEIRCSRRRRLASSRLAAEARLRVEARALGNVDRGAA